jgi:hypothetical protein
MYVYVLLFSKNCLIRLNLSYELRVKIIILRLIKLEYSAFQLLLFISVCEGNVFNRSERFFNGVRGELNYL